MPRTLKSKRPVMNRWRGRMSCAEGLVEIRGWLYLAPLKAPVDLLGTGIHASIATMLTK